MTCGERTLNHHLALWAEHLSNPALTEICVNKPGEYATEISGIWHWHSAPHLTFDRLDGIGKLAAGLTRQTLDNHTPRASSVLPGRLRIQIARPPAVQEGTYSLTIRKRATDFVPTLPWLAERGYFAHLPQNRDWVAWWTDAVRTRHTLLIAGAIGSSKTTFGEALIHEIPLDERIITIEKVPEWNLLHRNWVSSLYGASGDGKAAERAATQCVEDALRQRPDRILVGELRNGGEAWAYIRAMLAGHPGGITTLHAESTAGTMDALAMMLRQDTAGSTMSDADLRALIRRSVHIIAHCARDPYRLTAVEEIS
jgi:type IV secretion system protein VirB11